MYPDAPGDNTFRILGIDPGTSTLGISIIDVDITDLSFKIIYAVTLTGEPIDPQYKHLALTRFDRDARLLTLKRKIRELLETVKPHCVAAESPFANMKTMSAFEPLVECQWIIREVVWSCSESLIVHRITPPTAKASVDVDHRGSKKKDVQDAVVKKLATFSDIDLTLLDEHCIDSIAVGYAVYVSQIQGKEIKTKGKTKKIRSKSDASKRVPRKKRRKRRK